jgi:3-hydroxyisobutyrate dehydrogenase-like beta-hydroxyacid dehydrogenase
VLVGGDAAGLERARPVLETFAGKVFHLGDVGAGATMKLVVNSVVAVFNAALGEALVLAEKAGIDPQRAYDVLQASAAGAPYVTYKRAAFLDPENSPVAFTLALVAKDQGLIDQLATEVGTTMALGDAARQLVADALEAGLGERDMAAIAEHIRRT